MTSQNRERAQRKLNNLRSFVRRSNLTGWVRDRSARYQYEDALRAVVAIEDDEGVEAAASLSDRLRSLRWEAERAGLLTPTEVLESERAVMS